MPFSDSLASRTALGLFSAILSASSRAPPRSSSRLHHRLEGAEAVGLLGADRLAAVEHAAHLLDREHAQQVRCRAERAAIDLRKPEGRVLGGDDDVARAHDPDAAAEHEAVRRGDHGHRAVVDRREGVVAALVDLGDQAAVGGELLDVDPGAEAAPLGGDQHDAHALVLARAGRRARRAAPSPCCRRRSPGACSGRPRRSPSRR